MSEAVSVSAEEARLEVECLTAAERIAREHAARMRLYDTAELRAAVRRMDEDAAEAARALRLARSVVALHTRVAALETALRDVCSDAALLRETRCRRCSTGVQTPHDADCPKGHALAVLDGGAR